MVTNKHRQTGVSSNAYAFGSSEKRFGPVHIHPNLNPNGFNNPKSRGNDPCLYHPVPIHCITTTQQKDHKDPWRYKNELEEWARNLGYRNQKVLEQRQWTKSILGPAWHEIEEPKGKMVGVCMNVGFGRTPRSRPSKINYPAPGTYYRDKPFKAPHGPHSTRPTFLREEPCRFKDTAPRWSLAPDRYRIIDKDSIEQKPNKIVSLKGPYQLFSRKRDNNTVISHYSTAAKVSAATWPIALPGSLDKYTKSHFGTMNKTNRDKPYRGRSALVDITMCPKKPSDPGPGHYNIETKKPWKQNEYGFNSSNTQPVGYVRTVVWPGVGRYTIGYGPNIPGHGHRQVFLSKQERTIGAYLPQPMNTF